MIKVDLSGERKVIEQVLKALGESSTKVSIGGGYAPIIYSSYLANGLNIYPVKTPDLDVLLGRTALPKEVNIAAMLKDAGFQWQQKNSSIPPVECYKKTIDGEEIEVEFITDNRSREGGLVTINGITAQPLSYLEMSISNTQTFKTESGLTGAVVSPGSWVFHKGLTFTRRPRGSSKRYKDLYGIWFVLSQLGPISEDCTNELIVLMKEYPKWAKSFTQNMTEFAKNATPKDWESLELQDPTGTLRVDAFKETVLNCEKVHNVASRGLL